ncbi:response regulator [Hydrogenovibrio sp. JE_KL2]|uniref:response regulator n=1 Tax=Hydrogenovibrio sp. JE_KL2 TaxID=2651188 RepID=UPI001561CA6F|nr:response regulator [Hydrogenovibrio sp. JE_KL2]
MELKNLLLVEDELTSLKLLEFFLKDDPFALTIARNGKQASDILANYPPDHFQCIISDINMPEMSGLNLLKQLKQDPDRKHIPVILQTAVSGEEDIQQGLELGAFYYLLKPITKQTLVSLITAALQDYENYREAARSLHEIKEPSPLLKSGQFTFKTIKEAKNLAQFLALMTSDPETIAMGLLELMINAIEHGNLGITYDEKTQLVATGKLRDEISRRLTSREHRDKFVTVDLNRDDGKLTISVKDMGKGFDFEKYMDFSLERAMDNHGRGIMMANKLSFDDLCYTDNGSTAVCVTSKL